MALQETKIHPSKTRSAGPPPLTLSGANPPNWHASLLEVVLHTLKVEPKTGLSQAEVESRLAAWGKNILPKGKKTTALQMFLRQFGSPLVYILLIAATLTWWIREYADMAIILVVVVGNAIIGLFQEYRASKIFEKLKEIVRVEALVIREGKLHVIDSEDLVPGDIIVLKGGNKVPADARLLEGANLQTNEALLTGESKPSRKQPGVTPQKTLVGDRHNMVFMGTVIEEGDGQAVVVATGAKTEVGQISLMTQEAAEEDSPLKMRMDRLAGFLTKVFVTIAALIFVIGWIEGDPVIEMFKTTIAVAVAAIPEGLPAVISIILAVSSKKILERKGLVMKLIAAETLGSTSVICTDKTGTLTFGQMRVEQILTEKKEETYLAMALANEAVVEEKNGQKIVRGEATDKAKMESFLRGTKQDPEEILAQMPRIGLTPFDSDRKIMASYHNSAGELKTFVAGAPETVLGLSTLTQQKKEEIKNIYEDLAKRGFRLIALANKEEPWPSEFKSQDGKISQEQLLAKINNLNYLGLAAIRDPIREDVKEALKVTRLAGIKVMMITGDHILTAKAIGLELGFGTSGPAVVTGEELDGMTPEDLKSRVGNLEIIARAAPAHKMRVIDAWQKLGAVVAMTGDGVNDAPALKSADIGIAVGSGTDVAKEASDLILLDDGFATITAAVQEGRTGFANIRKATVVVMSNAFTEIVLITGALIFSVPFPVTAVMILWVNIVEDGLPVLALAFEPAEPGIMQRKPLSPKEPILDYESKFIIFAVGILTDALLFGIFMYLLKFSTWDIVKIQSFIFVATATPTLVNVFAFKSLRNPLWKIDLFNNRVMILATVFGFVLMFGAIYSPIFNKFLKTSPLPFWAAALCFLVFPMIKLSLVELTKWWQRSREV